MGARPAPCNLHSMGALRSKGKVQEFAPEAAQGWRGQGKGLRMRFDTFSWSRTRRRGLPGQVRPVPSPCNREVGLASAGAGETGAGS